MKTLIDFSKFSSIKIGPKLEVNVIDNICDTKNFTIIGAACNLLLSPNPVPLAILSQKFDYIFLENEFLFIGAKTPAKKIFNFAKEHNLAGFELCASVPGTLGGLLKMNAGLKGFNISDNLIFLTCNTMKKKDECEFKYRSSNIQGVIFSAVFKAKKGFNEKLVKDFELARKNQPKGASFGSVFKNPQNDSAGRLIEAVGLKGKKIGDCSFSSLHANFLINHGKGSFEDALSLINLAKNEVKAKFNISLQEEVVIL